MLNSSDEQSHLNANLKQLNEQHFLSQALHGLAPKCKLINMHELINKSTNDYATLLPCEIGVNVSNRINLQKCKYYVHILMRMHETS